MTITLDDINSAVYAALNILIAKSHNGAVVGSRVDQLSSRQAWLARGYKYASTYVGADGKTHYEITESGLDRHEEFEASWC